MIPGDLQLKENEHLHFSKFVGSPFLWTAGRCHDGTGPVRMPTAEPAGSVAAGTGFLDGACTESTRTFGRCGRKLAWKFDKGLCCKLFAGDGGGGGLSKGLLLKVSDIWIGCWIKGSLSGT